jgi:hypothetical protein
MKGMRKVIALTCATLCTSIGPALAATDSITVSANIQEVVSVSITGNSNSFDVTAGSAISDQDIATITINSNDADGYDVTLAGTNATSILENADTDETMAYTVSYNGGTDIGLTTSPTNVENVTAQTEGEVTRSLTLSISASESVGKSAESFTDTITVEILGK